LFFEHFHLLLLFGHLPRLRIQLITQLLQLSRELYAGRFSFGRRDIRSDWICGLRSGGRNTT
jgi:hypothetical protein